MRAAIYIRVSTMDQAIEGFSLEAQKRRLIAYCESQDWNITGIYVDEGVSAKDLDRKYMKKMLQDMEHGLFDIVLCYKLDRLTRSVSDCNDLLKKFERYNIKFQSATEPFETRTATGRLFIHLVSVLAQFEREQLAERVVMGMKEKAMQGKKPGGRFPYGYDKQGELVTEEAEILRELRRLYVDERLGFKTIAMTLNQKPENLRRGILWTASTVALTLENIFYAGIIRFGGKRSDGKYSQRKKELQLDVIESVGSHEPVWTKEEYDEHISLMRMRTDGGYSRKLDYWFSGLLRCGKCGGGMYGRMTMSSVRKNGERTRIPYYWCSNRKANNSCNMPMLRQTHIEHLLLSYIQSIGIQRDMVTEASKEDQKKQKNTEKEVAKLKRELDSIRERNKKWQYAFVNDLISGDDLRERLDEEEQKRVSTEQRITQLQGIESSETDVVVVQIQSMAEAWDVSDDSEKQEMLRILFDKITIHTDLDNVKGVKNKFFDAQIEVAYR